MHAMIQSEVKDGIRPKKKSKKMEELKEFSQISVSDDEKSRSKEEEEKIYLIPATEKHIQELISILILKMASNPEKQIRMRYFKVIMCVLGITVMK